MCYVKSKYLPLTINQSSISSFEYQDKWINDMPEISFQDYESCIFEGGVLYVGSNCDENKSPL